LYLKYSEGTNDEVTVGDFYTPIYKNIKVILKPTETYTDKSKYAAYVHTGSYYSFLGGTWLGESIEFNTKKLGKFKLLKDDTPPTVRLKSKSNSKIRVKISDNLSGIKSYRATLDGEFLCMAYRYQTGILTSIPQDSNKDLKGLFELTVVDNMNNEKIYTLQL